MPVLPVHCYEVTHFVQLRPPRFRSWGPSFPGFRNRCMRALNSPKSPPKLLKFTFPPSVPLRTSLTQIWARVSYSKLTAPSAALRISNICRHPDPSAVAIAIASSRFAPSFRWVGCNIVGMQASGCNIVRSQAFGCSIVGSQACG